jgi:DNA polymerase-1
VKILLLDGNSLAYRAFFALPTDMATATGQVTNAVYGFATMLINLVKDQRPDGVAVVFDRKEKTFRHEAAPEYKAQRETQPDILYQQIDIIKEMLDAFGIPRYELAGFEGDDIIATLAVRAGDSGIDTVIVTGDRDTYQLVRDPHIKVLYNKRGVSDYALYDEAGILERTGVTPDAYPLYAALRGDPSDNLEGVPGVGEKTAAKLINKYGTLEAIFDAADDQTPKMSQSLRESRDRVLRNAGLMWLRRDVPVDVDVTALAPKPNMSRIRTMFESLEFKTMYSRAVNAFGPFSDVLTDDPIGNVEPSVATVVNRLSSRKDVDGVIKAVVNSRRRTVMPCWRGDGRAHDLAGLAVVEDAPSGRVAWIDGADLLVSDLDQLAPIVTHDAKLLERWTLANSGSTFAVDFDTAIAAYLLDPQEGKLSVSSVVERFGGPDLGLVEKTPSGQLEFGASEDAVSVTCSEALALDGVVDAMAESLAANGASTLFESIELPLIPVLARMEDVGVGVDRSRLALIADHLTEEVARLTVVLHELAGREFNLNSPMQLRTILFDERKLSPGKKTKTGYSTDAATLEKIRDQWPEFIDPLLRYREVEKLRSTYGVGLLESIASDGRIHATFNQMVARTGRLSSDAPNLHNIPVRSDEGRVFREAFVPSAGCQLLVADYNQIELRCIAHLADDPGLIGAFTKGEDIHTSTAARVFGVHPSEVTPDMRSQAKMVSYGLAYGMEAYGLGQRLGIGVEEASSILNSYFAAFPNVRRYMDEAVEEARARGYTETLFGRRRPIPELNSSNFRIRQVGERQAMNAAIQGLAADIFKVALVRVQHRLDEEQLSSRIILQVHDEIIVEAPDVEHDVVEKIVLETMMGAADLRVPLEVNMAWGSSWAAAKH